MTTDMSAPDTVVSMARDPFLNTDDACGYLGVPKATLLTWRVRRPGYGPRQGRRQAQVPPFRTRPVAGGP